MTRRIIFICIVLAVLALLHVVVFAVWSRVYGVLADQVVLLAIISAGVLMFLNALPRIKDTPITSLFYVFGSTWLGTIFLIFFATVVYQLYALLFGDAMVVYQVAQGIAVIAAFYAIFNADWIDTKHLTIPFPHIKEPIRLVHLSDIHIGTVHRKSFLQQVVNMTNAQNPDLVLITGDLFDGSAPVYPDMLTPLDELQAPAYFSHGNHEEYEGLPLVKETIKDLKLELLANRCVTWNGIEIIGVNDVQSLTEKNTLETILTGLPLSSNAPKILLFHTPVDWKVARAHNISLMLSGHTHNGQLFPFTLLVRLAFKYVCGLYEEGGKYLHVTPGTGTWGPPMRLGSRNQITLIELAPLK